MPSPNSAASRCSTVPTVASPRPSLVASSVETTSLERAGISTGSPKSERTNTIPEFARAGCSVSCTAFPLCSPTPVQDTFSAIVRWSKA